MPGTGTERRRSGDNELQKFLTKFEEDQKERHDDLKDSLENCHRKIDAVQNTHNDFLQGNANVGYIFSKDGPWHSMEKDVKRHNDLEISMKALMWASPFLLMLAGFKDKILSALHLK